jgi:uncharacterized protein (DUF305 family)
VNRMTLISTLVAALATVVLAGCGGGGTPAAPAPAPTTTPAAAHNDADVAFVRGMIPHHAQAIQMSQLAEQRATNPQVKQLATTITQGQGPELEQMQAMLQSWGLPAQPTGPGAMSGMPGATGMPGMTGMPATPGMPPAMPGMMSDGQMQQLGQASGREFDRMWLQMMIQHHTGAVQMAETELREGQNAQAKALAQKIIDEQRAQIAQMQKLLQTI